MATADQRFSLRWNNYQTQLVTAFESLLDQQDFVDVTIGVEGKKLSAHKMLLSACSPFFRELLKVSRYTLHENSSCYQYSSNIILICVSYFLCSQENPCQHPIIVLRDIKYEDVNSLLHFMYNGEVNVAQDSLNSFLKCAESLRVRGLTDEESSRVSAVPAPGTDPGQHRERRRRSSRDDGRSTYRGVSVAEAVPSSRSSHPPNVKEEMMEVPDEAAAARYRSEAAAAPPGREVVPVHDNIEEGEEQIDEPVSEGHQGKPKQLEINLNFFET